MRTAFPRGVVARGRLGGVLRFHARATPDRGLLFIALLAGSGSGCHEQPRRERDERAPMARGDVVVVERAAADFFQARVLSVSDSTLKVQTSDEGEPMIVARSDAYRAPGPPHRFAAGDPAICSDRPARWAPCRVSKVDGALLGVVLGAAEQRELPSSAVLAPTPVTALDIRRYFHEIAAHGTFAEAARAGGSPPRPSGWLPEPHEPVLGRRGDDWYSAHVLQLLEEGGVRLVWDGSERPESLSRTDIVPVPPFEHPPTRGGFVLIRPATAGQAWPRVRLEGLGPEEAVVVGEDGARRRVDVRGIVPLVSVRRDAP
jgi:hypothetical protein